MQDDINELKTMVRAVINGQSSLKAELIAKIEATEKKLENKIENLETEMKKGFKDVNHRVDLLGKQLNVLDDDAPTSEDFAKLVKRVDKLEKYQNFATA